MIYCRRAISIWRPLWVRIAICGNTNMFIFIPVASLSEQLYSVIAFTIAREIRITNHISKENINSSSVCNKCWWFTLVFVSNFVDNLCFFFEDKPACACSSQHQHWNANDVIFTQIYCTWSFWFFYKSAIHIILLTSVQPFNYGVFERELTHSKNQFRKLEVLFGSGIMHSIMLLINFLVG